MILFVFLGFVFVFLRFIFVSLRFLFIFLGFISIDGIFIFMGFIFMGFILSLEQLWCEFCWWVLPDVLVLHKPGKETTPKNSGVWFEVLGWNLGQKAAFRGRLCLRIPTALLLIRKLLWGSFSAEFVSSCSSSLVPHPLFQPCRAGGKNKVRRQKQSPQVPNPSHFLGLIKKKN